jgi:hypothetical protein
MKLNRHTYLSFAILISLIIPLTTPPGKAQGEKSANPGSVVFDVRTYGAKADGSTGQK